MKWALILIFTPFKVLGSHELYLTQHIKEVATIVTNMAGSCIGDALTNHDTAAFYATKELTEITNSVSQILKEELITLALKKDFPNFCHVMAQEILNQVEEKTYNNKECITRDPIWRKCLVYRETKTPEFKYYWPKYFIEVSEKGNDSFPAFSQGNLLYEKNRSIANNLSSMVDLRGPFQLVEKVLQNTLTLKMIQASTKALTGYGFDLSPNSQDIESLVKIAIFTQFEKLRIRANKNPDMPSYEVNIWPVGLSSSFAKNLGVCGKGGYDWPLNSQYNQIPVPMTCPVAMSKDAWSYWDSGMIDYLNPSAIAGMVAATNPTSCIASNLTSTAFDNLKSLGQGQQIIDKKCQERKNIALSNLPNSFRGIGLCSLPILGSSEAIIGQLANTFNNFKGPWCSIWGPVAPRHSTQIHANDYGFANAALKFKLLAHDIFGVQRGKKERWALAYPWEDNSTFLNKQKAWMKDLFSKLKIPSEKIANFIQTPSFGRSTTLMIPGDPRMLDSFNRQDLAGDTQNFLKEFAYAASLGKKTANMSPEAKVAAWISAEIARAEYEEASGASILPGKKRIFTIFEEISCKPRKSDGGELKKQRILGFDYWNDCGAAIRYEVRKYVQQHLIRPICDNVMKDHLGEPFK